MAHSNVIDFLQERSFLDGMTSPQLRDHLETPRSLYVGFDPTADSLHLGNLVGIIALEWFRRLGHTPYVVLGGATARIGDPSGKSSERPLLEEEELKENVASIRRFFEQVFPDLHVRVVDNQTHFSHFNIIDFLRDVGKFFRIGPMLAKESVRSRVESDVGMSFTEFSYQILQAYDFSILNENHGITLQLGGSDQWGNITAGIEYQRKKGKEPLFGLTFPLLTRSDGKKFGKSEEGAIWLSSKRLSPYQFYQHLIQIPDADVISLLTRLTFLEMDEIREIEKSMGSKDYVPNSAQKKLATEITRFIHGEEGLSVALSATEGLVGKISEGEVPDARVLEQLVKDVPHSDMAKGEILGKEIVSLAVQANLLKSKSEARRIIENRGLYLNNQPVVDVKRIIHAQDFIAGRFLLLRLGKKKYFLLRTIE